MDALKHTHTTVREYSNTKSWIHTCKFLVGCKKKKNVDGALDVCYDGGTDGTFLDEHFRFLNDGAGLLDPISSELTILVFCNRNICL